MPSHPLPSVGIVASVRQLADYRVHAVPEQIVVSVRRGADALPLLLPPLGDGYDYDDLVSRLDGLVLTGSPCHVNPALYDGNLAVDANQIDRDRAATTLPLIRAALQAGLPLFAICMGMQELNVALGGTLRFVEPSALVHTSNGSGVPLEAWMRRDQHDIMLTPRGLLHQAYGADAIAVNSAHTQAVDRVADGLRVEAVAADGVIEALSVADSKAFALGVQWHPEYAYDTDHGTAALYKAFGDAVRQRQQERAPSGASA